MFSTRKEQKILIVEDDLMSYKLIEIYLKETNYNLIHARNGDEAMVFFNKEDVQLILMDLQLPGITGLDVTRQIRQIDTEIPIIAATADAGVEAQIATHDAGCTEHITKPINFLLLKDLLSKYLGE